MAMWPSSRAAPLLDSLTRIEKTLDRIGDHLQQAERLEHVREFSLLDLTGSLFLVVAIVFVIAAVLALLQANANLGRGWAAVALLGSIAMQGLSLTMFTLSRRK